MFRSCIIHRSIPAPQRCICQPCCDRWNLSLSIFLHVRLLIIYPGTEHQSAHLGAVSCPKAVSFLSGLLVPVCLTEHWGTAPCVLGFQHSLSGQATWLKCPWGSVWGPVAVFWSSWSCFTFRSTFVFPFSILSFSVPHLTADFALPPALFLWSQYSCLSVHTSY